MRHIFLLFIYLNLNLAILFVSTCFSSGEKKNEKDLSTTQEHLAASLVNITESTLIKREPSESMKNELLESQSKGNLEKQNSTRQNQTSNKDVKHNIHIEDEKFRLSSKFVETYLYEFGYLNTTKENLTDAGHLIPALKAFQEYFQILPANGKMDLRTTEHMLRKRCSVPDVYPKPPHFIWERSSLRYFLVVPSHINLKKWLPMNMKLSDLKELIRQAFSAWEIVISMDFIEETKSEANADIIFEISEIKNDSLSYSGLGIASGSPSLKSRIWLHRDEKWSTFQVQEEEKLDIFLVLIHEIGHTLGLEHSHDKSSVMYPIFERDVGEQLPVINNDDVERLRMLYDPEEEVLNLGEVPQGKGDGTAPLPPDCPSSLWATTQSLTNGDIFLFLDVNCWHFNKDRKLIEGPKPISSIFPDAPLYVDVAISSDNLTVLIQERTLFGYTIDPVSGKIEKVKGYPKPLHSRVLFYPDSAFPLANGSVILLRDNVFATFNLQANEPTMLNDKTVFFPNLPTDLRSGIFASDPIKSRKLDTIEALEDHQMYWMFGANTVTLYNFDLQKSLNTETLPKFLKCNSYKKEQQNGKPEKHRLDNSNVTESPQH